LFIFICDEKFEQFYDTIDTSTLTHSVLFNLSSFTVLYKTQLLFRVLLIFNHAM